MKAVMTETVVKHTYCGNLLERLRVPTVKISLDCIVANGFNIQIWLMLLARASPSASSERCSIPSVCNDFTTVPGFVHSLL